MTKSSWELDLDRMFELTAGEGDAPPRATATPPKGPAGRERTRIAAHAEARRIVERAETDGANLRLQAHKDGAAAVERVTANAKEDAARVVDAARSKAEF